MQPAETSPIHPIPFFHHCFPIFPFLSPPPLSFFPSVFFSRDLQLLNATLFLPTGPSSPTHTKRENHR